MARLVSEVTIQRSPEAVWAFVTDLARVPEWVWFTRRLLLVEGKGEGCRYVERGPFGKSRWAIVSVIPGRAEVHAGRIGPARIVLTDEVIPGVGGTTFRQTVEWTALPRFRALGWLLERTVIHPLVAYGMKRTTPNAKRLLEA